LIEFRDQLFLFLCAIVYLISLELNLMF